MKKDLNLQISNFYKLLYFLLTNAMLILGWIVVIQVVVRTKNVASSSISPAFPSHLLPLSSLDEEKDLNIYEFLKKYEHIPAGCMLGALIKCKSITNQKKSS